MKSAFKMLMVRGEKRRKAAALQDAGALAMVPASREASWNAPILWRFCVAIILGLVLFNSPAFASDITADFSAANRLYAEGKFPEAAGAYEKILQTGAQSPALWFNCGNAEFKAGHLGKAIAAYRRAQLLSPREPELRANLAYARNQVQGATQRPARWQNWVGSLTLNEGALVTAVCFWAVFGLLIARQLRPALAPRLRTATRLAAVLAVFSATVLGVQAAEHFTKSVAVVTADNVAVRSGPFADAQNVFTARDGAELRVLGRHDDWIQVSSDAGRIGWLNIGQVEVLPGA